jgi:glycosyltransferase domain-containing protein
MEHVLSVLMPLYGKSEYTIKYLNYFVEESPKNILLMMFDADKQLDSIEYNFTNNIQIDKIYMDRTANTYVKSLYEMLKKVKTKYVMFNDNDDYPFFSGISDALQVLDGNRNLDWVGGLIGHFYHDPIFKNKVFLRDKRNPKVKNLKDKLSGQYQQEWYNIYRTESLKKMFSLMVEARPIEWNHPEVFHSLFTSLQNGVYVKNYIYFREVLISNSSASLISKNGDHVNFSRNTEQIIKTQINELVNWEIKELIIKLLNNVTDRRIIYITRFLKTILFKLKILNYIDKKLAMHTEGVEKEFFKAKNLISNYYR